MIPLTDSEVEEIIDIAYSTSERYILKHVNKKEFEDINITINLERGSEGFDIDIDIDLDSDVNLPDDLADAAINLSLDAVDEYVENRNKSLD
ncbi:MAG: DUF3194 domain-containing protein [Methanosphaera sp.]|uniref:DUF3194 domain-containing protein n=1 Tax=Methanosphaera sp. ISO3-F5 TaxID=1452353 RepID=UPI002B25EF22|nr:DUF3194 domain-containing protein [Methanosphaera sp. ISO3-F5]MBR0472189.1 DUF3194 domain-containing protein [Methanosphaera sp.]WQH64461.1 DUF3194 domain-containing protein [Methanosphaera sp. ISO3-F5]